MTAIDFNKILIFKTDNLDVPEMTVEETESISNAVLFFDTKIILYSIQNILYIKDLIEQTFLHKIVTL